MTQTEEPIAQKPTLVQQQAHPPRKQLLLVGALTLLAFTIGCVAFKIISTRVPCDFQAHARDAQQSLENLRWPCHFLFFLVVGVLSLLTSGSETAFLNVSVLVVACAIAAKFFLSVKIAERELGWASMTAPVPRGQRFGPQTLVLLGLFLLLFAHSLPRTPLYFSLAGQAWPSHFSAYCFYVGRATSSLWHNSTAVFSVPFAMLLFYESSLLLSPRPVVRPVRLLAWTALVIAAKPSLLLVMVPVLPVMVFLQHRFSRAFWAACGTAAFAALLMAAQHRWLSANGPGGYQVTIGFLAAWGPYVPVFPLDLIGSFAYPLLFALLFPTMAWKDRVYRYAAVLTAVGVLIGAMLCLKPPFVANGNFMWQIHLCCYFWFLATFLVQARDLSTSQRQMGWRNILVFTCLGLHILNGVAYLIRSFVIGTYM